MKLHNFKINTVNYVAISLLEKLGNNQPTQQQIDLMEILVLIILRPGILTQQMLEVYLKGEDAIVRSTFSKYFKKINENV